MGVFPNAFMNKTKPAIENLARNYKNYSLDYRMGSEMTSEKSAQ
jgi:hypothetical protein